MVLAMGLNIEPINMWHKKLSSEKTWDHSKEFLVEEYHAIRQIKRINTNQAGFHGSNMDIKIQDGINGALENLTMAKTPEKYVLTQLTRTIKQLAETNIF